MLTEILIILALILLNGLFSGAEIALLSIRKTRLQELIEGGNQRAQAVARLREHPEGFLATVQIGITVVGATAAAFGGASVAERLAPVLAAVPGLAEASHSLALGIVVVGVSFLSLVLGELVPKSLALRAAEDYALLLARPLEALAWVARPLVLLLTGASNLVLRVFGDRTTFTETRLSREEIQQIMEEAATAGSVDPDAGEIASRALDFSTLDAYTVMVPRSEVMLLPKHSNVQDIAEATRRSGLSRIPLFEDTPENIVGFVNVRDVLATAALGEDRAPSEMLHSVLFVPDGMPATAVLRTLQDKHAHLAIVLDEQGTFVGLVTVEDLVEELVGEILSENDRPRSTILREPGDSWMIAGNTPLHEVNRVVGIELPEGDFATIAGLCLHLAGFIPTTGTTLLTEDGASLEVVEATPRKIKRVRLRRAPSENR